jgi:hypothetical protein
MSGFISEGQVTLNAEGRRYAASFHVGRGVMTVKLGSVSRIIHIHGPMHSPESAARTILRTMVREDPTLGHQ